MKLVLEPARLVRVLVNLCRTFLSARPLDGWSLSLRSFFLSYQEKSRDEANTTQQALFAPAWTFISTALPLQAIRASFNLRTATKYLEASIMGEPSASHVAAEPEAKVLVIMTGGTICMQKSSNGLIPARGFLETCMSPRPEFNDGTVLDDIDVRLDDNPSSTKAVKSLRTPTSVYGKRIR
jgi:hypothetical protein